MAKKVCPTRLRGPACSRGGDSKHARTNFLGHLCIVKINVVKGCVSAVSVHATFDHVNLDSRVRGGTIPIPKNRDSDSFAHFGGIGIK